MARPERHRVVDRVAWRADRGERGPRTSVDRDTTTRASRHPFGGLVLLLVAPIAPACTHRAADLHPEASRPPLHASPSAVAPASSSDGGATDHETPLEGLVLEWTSDDAERGSEFMQVQGDGSAELVLMDPHGYRHRASPRYDRATLDALIAELRAAEVCTLRPARPLAPGDAAATMRVRLPGMACDVTLPRRQWDEDPAASRSSAWFRDARMHVHGR
jgi:hypothetical protein